MNDTHAYASLPADHLESHLSNYLITHWSISGVNTFVRNEKAFEKYYVFKDYSDVGKSSSQVVGTCYHLTLKSFFEEWRDYKKKLSIERMLEIAYKELDEVELVDYKVYINKNSQEVKDDAQKKINNLILQFLEEVDVYLDDIKEIIFIEERVTEFVTLNGVDLPLPIKLIPDLIYINNKDELCGLDHKSKGLYTKENEKHLHFAFQSTGYDLGVSAHLLRPEYASLVKKYPKIEEGMKQFRFYENKFSKNRDKTPQIHAHQVNIDETRELYEAILFEPVWRIIHAVQDPDYVYLMNPMDFFEDGGEIVEFWIKTHLQDLSAFQNLNEKQKLILSQRKSIMEKAALAKVPKNVVEAITGSKKFISFDYENMKDKPKEERIQLVLRSFNINAEVREVIQGYSCDTYLLRVGVGTKISKVAYHKLDLAQVLGVETIRVSSDLVRRNNESYLAIEVNRDERKSVKLTDKDMAEGLALPIGVDNFGELVAWDIENAATPHFMLSGASGSGKSVTIRTMVHVALKKGIKVAILDPKNEFRDLQSQCEVYSEQDEIETFIGLKVIEMDEHFKSGKADAAKQIVFFDEVADCLSRQTKSETIQAVIGNYADGREKTALRKDKDFRTLEENLLILGQKARSAGIHLVLAAQRFSTKILTGDVKANFTIRLALTSAKAVDSMVMLDEEGAEKLTGRGDGLLVSPSLRRTTRVQCFTT
ncbi:MAG: DNA translocase FtsK [Nitrosomonadaceae bacterium]